MDFGELLLYFERIKLTIDLSADAKSVRLDIYVEDEKNTVYNIEMQTVENRNIPRRTRYYQGIMGKSRKMTLPEN